MVNPDVAPEQYAPRPLRWDRPVPAALQRVADQQLAWMMGEAGLTRRQRTLIWLTRKGRSPKQISLFLKLSEKRTEQSLYAATRKLEERFPARAGTTLREARDLIRAHRNRHADGQERETWEETGLPSAECDSETTAVHGRPFGSVPADLARRWEGDEPTRYLLGVAKRLAGELETRQAGLAPDEFRGPERAEWLKRNTGRVGASAGVG